MASLPSLELTPKIALENVVLYLIANSLVNFEYMALSNLTL